MRDKFVVISFGFSIELILAPLIYLAEIRNVLGNQSCAMALIDNCLTGDYFIIQHCTEILENLSFKGSPISLKKYYHNALMNISNMRIHRIFIII